MIKFQIKIFYLTYSLIKQILILDIICHITVHFMIKLILLKMIAMNSLLLYRNIEIL